MENDIEPLRFLTLRETAGLLRLSGRTVLRMVQQKQLPAFKVGGQWRVRTDELAKRIQDFDEL